MTNMRYGEMKEKYDHLNVHYTSMTWLSLRQLLQAGSLSASWALGPSGLIVNDTLHSFMTLLRVAK